MKETGIIFNGKMVRATLSDRKTQTRRIVTPQPDEDGLARLRGGPWMDTSERVYLCPFGKVGDRLYVRETWGVVSHAFDDDGFMISWIPDRPATAIDEMPFGKGYYSGHAIYAADGAFTWGDDDGHEDGRSRWKPSIHMPRAASRILLEITDVRVERLNDISEQDAIAEGLERYNDDGIVYYGPYGHGDCRPEIAFSDLWQSIYGTESWDANPWCWAITFKRIERDQKMPILKCIKDEVGYWTEGETYAAGYAGGEWLSIGDDENPETDWVVLPKDWADGDDEASITYCLHGCNGDVEFIEVEGA